MRHRMIMFNPQFLVRMMSVDLLPEVIVKNSLPVDTKYVRSFTDDISGHGRIGIVVESEKFEDISIGERMPEHLIEFTTKK